MTKVTIDLSRIRNEVSLITNEAFNALNGDQRKHREALGRLVEKLRTLQSRLKTDSTQVEIK